MDQKNIFKALSEFQNEIPIIHKGSSGYGYTYTDLPEIVKVITPYLTKHKLGYTQPIVNNQLKTVLFHWESSEYIESLIDIPEENLKGMNKFQILGSGITYLRRYALSSMLGLVTDSDMDASTIDDKLSRIDNLNELNALYKKIKPEDQVKFKNSFSNRKKELENNNQNQ